MALAQLVVALSFLAHSSGNKDIRTDMKSRPLFMNTPPQNATDQQREGNDKHTRFLRWALNNPTEEFSLVPFSPEAMEENQQSSWGHGTRRSASLLLNAPPPLDKIEGRYVTRELMEPDFKGIESLKEEALINRRSAMDPEFTTSHKALNQFRTKRSDFKAISGLNDDVRLVKRLDKIDRGEWPLSGRRGRIEKSGFDIRKRIPGSGYDSWEKKNFDDSDRYGYSDMKKRNFDEIDRAGFHSLSRRNFDEIDRAGFHSLGRRNFDEIDRAGLHSLGRRNFDEIDRAGFRSLGKRNFDEIDRAGFHSLGRRNFDEIDKSAFRGFGKRDFDEIDRSGFRSFGKRNFDEIDRSGFRELGKRSIGHSTLFDDNSKDSGEAYKVEDNESRKRSSDDADKVVLRNFSKRSTDGERSKIST